MNLNEIAREAFAHACKAGFHPAEVAAGELPTREYAVTRIALIHSEVSEALEELRKQDAPINSPAFAEELADVIIRVGDLAQMVKIDLDSAVVAKIEFNRTRPYRHNRRAL